FSCTSMYSLVSYTFTSFPAPPTAEFHTLSLHDALPIYKILLYPNPATSQTTLAVNVEVSSIIIHNMNGQMISNLDPQMLKSDRGKYILPLSNMSQGLYMVTLVGNNGMIDQLRLLVNP